MRHVGTLPPGRPAGGLLAALAAHGLEVELREGQLWVLDEDALPAALAELERFRRQPDHPDWRRALSEALARCEGETRAASVEMAARSRRAWKRERRLRRAWQGAAANRPLTLSLLAAGLFAAWAGSHETSALLPLVASLYWLHELGTHVESLRGSKRFALLLVSLAGTSHLVLAAAGFGLAGLSGIGFGLLGFAAARETLDTESGVTVPPGVFPLMAAWLIACAAGATGPAILLAQCAGLASGLIVGALPPLLRGFQSRASGSLAP